MSQVITAFREVGRLISTTDMKLARKLGEFVQIDKITGGKRCKYSTTDQGTICFWYNNELYELGEVRCDVSLQTTRPQVARP